MKRSAIATATARSASAATVRRSTAVPLVLRSATRSAMVSAPRFSAISGAGQAHPGFAALSSILPRRCGYSTYIPDSTLFNLDPLYFNSS